MNFSYSYKRKNTDEFIVNVETHDSELRSIVVKNQSKGTQTDYRESETQTIPWEPPYTLSKNNDKPEVLNLTNLHWNDGLPLGINEINIVKRMRMKRAWESVLPPLDSKVNVQMHNAIIAMIDKDEWASRDKELQLKMDLQLEWMNKMIKQNNIEQKKKGMERLEKIGKYLNQIRSKELFQIKREFNRKMRKLNLKHCGANSKVILNPIYNKKSREIKNDFYIFKPKFFNESLDSLKKYYDSILQKKFVNDTSDFRIKKIGYMTKTKCSSKQSNELCIRQTRWTDEKLQNLHEDLKNIRLNV